jgi:hypothetical protein
MLAIHDLATMPNYKDIKGMDAKHRVWHDDGIALEC